LIVSLIREYGARKNPEKESSILFLRVYGISSAVFMLLLSAYCFSAESVRPRYLLPFYFFPLILVLFKGLLKISARSFLGFSFSGRWKAGMVGVFLVFLVPQSRMGEFSQFLHPEPGCVKRLDALAEQILFPLGVADHWNAPLIHFFSKKGLSANAVHHELDPNFMYMINYDAYRNRGGKGIPRYGFALMKNMDEARWFKKLGRPPRIESCREEGREWKILLFDQKYSEKVSQLIFEMYGAV
jgi:hypothetical protein